MAFDAKHPLTPNERIVRSLFWDDRAQEWLDTWGLTQSEAESIILHDTRPVLDSHSQEAGHPILRFQRADVIIVVGFRERTKPKVLSVFVNIPGWNQSKARTAQASGPGTSLPKSGRQLKEWIIDFGYRLEFSRGGHLSVVNKETGQKICQIAATPSDHRTIGNEWRRFLREHTKTAKKIA